MKPLTIDALQRCFYILQSLAISCDIEYYTNNAMADSNNMKKVKRGKRHMNAHSYAISIEHILRNVFSCERGGFAGLIDADSIEKNSYVSIACTLGYLYAKSDTAKQAEIEKFINDYGFYLNFGIKDLLLFQTSERGIGGVSYTIDFDNGEKALEVIVEALSKVCKQDI